MTGLIIEGMSVRVSSPVLIGRSSEFARLASGLRLAQEGRSSATLLAGEAGVGKTRLIAEVVELADREGVVVLMGGWAYFRTPNIKIGGRILTADPSHRGADPLP